jgi:hypothetical protein
LNNDWPKIIRNLQKDQNMMNPSYRHSPGTNKKQIHAKM